jgi:glycosyltransferase involved in cell wall biosynthesis
MMKPAEAPRVLMVIWAYPPEFTGAGRQLATLAAGLSARGVRVRVLCSHEGREDLAEHDGPVEVRRLGTGTSGPRRLRRFGRRAFAWMLAHRREFDVVHVHGVSPATYAAAVAARLTRKPSLLKLTLLGDDDPLTVGATRLGGLKLRLLGLMRGVVAISTGLHDAVAASRLTRIRSWRVPNAVDCRRFAPLAPKERDIARQRVLDELGLPDDALLTVFIGGIERRKGVDLLAEAWPRVRETVPDAHLLLIGPLDHATADPAFRPMIEERLAASSGLSSVHFLGHRSAPERWLRCADLFTLPSRAEGFGSAVVEAEMAGLPVVVAELPGITPDVMVPGTTGLVVPQDDAEALASALTALLRDSSRRQEMGRAGAEWARDRFSLDSVVEAYLNIYRELLNHSA